MTAGSTRQMMATIQVGALMVALFVFVSGARAATTLTFQQGVSGYTGTQDTTLSGQAPTTNNEGATNLFVWERDQDNSNNFQRSLIRFDLSSITPSAVIGTATLTLTYGGDANITGNEGGFWFSGVTESLYVVNPSDVAWTSSTATWNNATTGQPWTGGAGLVAGTDYDATPIASAVTPNGPGTTPNETMAFTLNAAGIAMINDWIQNPTDNTGFFLREPSFSYTIDRVYSSEASTVSFRPELTLITTPEPASLTLLAVGGVTLLRRRRA